MAMFAVSLERTDSYYVEVEAESEEEALEIAFDNAPGICAMCSGYGIGAIGSVDDDEWHEPEHRPAVELIE